MSNDYQKKLRIQRDQARAEDLLSEIEELASRASAHMDDTIPQEVRTAIEKIAEKAANGMEHPRAQEHDLSKRLYNLAMVGLGLPRNP